MTGFPKACNLQNKNAMINDKKILDDIQSSCKINRVILIFSNIYHGLIHLFL